MFYQEIRAWNKVNDFFSQKTTKLKILSTHNDEMNSKSQSIY